MYPGSPPVRALAGVSLTVTRRGAGGGRGPVRVGQVHAAAPDGHPGPADRRHGADHRPGRGPAVRPASWPRCGRPGSGSCSSSSSSPSTQTVLDNVADGLLYAGIRRGERRRAGRRRAGRGSGWRTGPPPGRPSCRAGERQRVAIARALVGRAAGRAGRRADRQPRLGHRRTPSWPCSTSSTPPAPRSSSSPTTTRVAARMPRRIEMLDGRIVDRHQPPAPRSGAGSARRKDRHDHHVAAAGPRRGPAAARGPGRGWPASGCAPASCAPRCPRSASRSASPRSSPCSGLAASSQAGLLAEIDRLGTNLLTVTNGQTLSGDTAELPDDGTGHDRPDARRSPRCRTPAPSTASTPTSPRSSPRSTPTPSAWTPPASDLPAVVGTTLAQGRFLNAATAREPVAVLGAAAAQRLGIDRIWPGERIWVGGQWFYVTGILNPAVLAPEIDSAVLVGFPAAADVPRLRRPPVADLRPRRDTQASHRRRRQPARPPRQPGRPQPGQRLPALGRAHRPGRRQGRAQHPVPRPRRGRAAGRRDRRRQHHGHLRARTPLGDRAAPGAGRHPRPDPHPVPGRGDPARPWSAAPSASSSARSPPPSTPAATARPSSSRPRPGPAASPPPSLIGALAGLLPAIRAARLSPTQALLTL